MWQFTQDLAWRARSRWRLARKKTRAAEMTVMIGLVAEHNQMSMTGAFDLMYAHASPRERVLLAQYRPEEG